MYIDTGLEYPEIKRFVMKQKNVTVIRPEMNFKQVIEKYGYPLISKEVAQKIYDARKKPGGKVDGRFDRNDPYVQKYGGRYSMAKWKWLRDSDIPISHKCCTVMKKNPAKKFEKKTGLHPITGMMATESILRKTQWLKNGCNAFDGERPISHPLSFWTEQDVLEYIRRYNLPYCKVYGDIVRQESGALATTGLSRTGCCYCLFGIQMEKSPNRLERLKEIEPHIYEWVMKDWDVGGLGIKHIIDWINEHGMLNIKY